ncbi:sulfotransferase [Chloroflexota bacterium]
MGSFRSWLRLLREGGGIDLEFLPRVLFVTTTTLLTSPLRLYERLRFDKAVQQTTVHPSPLFIIGHWRTGTSHLHNLLCQDRSLGYLTTFQAAAPGFCLSGERLLKPLLAALTRRTHPTRVIDNMPLSMDAPQEEEVAIANLSPYSWLHTYTYPRRASHFFDRYTLFSGLPEPDLADWAEIYMHLLRKATLSSGGRRLVLKNPSHGGRLRQVLDLFPEAKFIYTVRNPYDLFVSELGTYRKVLPRSQVQRTTPGHIEEHVLSSGTRIMQKYLTDKVLIPPENLVQVKFEELERAPLEQLRRVYDRLAIPSYDQAEPSFRAYLDSIRGYQKNPYEIGEVEIDRVNQSWGFVFEPWHYPQLEGSTEQRNHGAS